MIRSDSYIEFGSLVHKVSKGVQTIFENTWVVELEDIEKESGRLLNQRFESEINSTKSVFTSEDILYSKLRPYLKKYVLPYSNGICTSELWVLRPNQKIPREYLFYLIQSPFFTRLTGVSSGSKMPRANWNYVKQSEVPLHSDENQRLKICKIFNQIDEKINLLTKKKVALEINKKGLIQKIFSQELRFKREDGTDYPEWRPTPLKAILKERKTLSSDTDSIELVSLTKEGVVAKSERYNREFLVKDASKKYKMTLMNDICYNPANLKFGVICRNTFGKALFSPIYVTFEVNNHLAENSFIELFVTTQNFIQKALKYQEGTVYERMAVKPNDLVRSVIQLPCIDEQKRIVSLIEALAAKEEILRSTIESTKLLKKGLLQQMFV
jgi:type I restriction enzyme, S subunit